ncbi:MAG: MFS transporter [Chloroflexi bacterium]|nr:MFS transporter [Chloroflexota bacterium]
MTLPNRRSYIVFGIISVGFLTSSISNTMVAVALPKMMEDLETNLAWAGWTLTGYQLAQSVSMPLAGKLSDDWGARRVFLWATALFTVGSFLCGFAPNIFVLIFARVLQSIAGGALLPAATSIASDGFGERRATAIGLFTAIYPLGGVIGPNIGGFVIDHFSWRWMFYGGVPVSALTLLAGLALIPRSERLEGGKPVDVVGAGLFAGSMVAILSAMTAWGDDAQSMRNPLTWLLVIAGVIALVVFLRHEKRSPAPVIELKLLTDRPLLASNFYNFLFGVSIFTLSSFVPYYATVAYGMSAGEGGAVLAPRSAAMVIASTVSSVLLIRWGYRMPMILGLVLNSVSLFLVSQGFHDLSLLGLQVPNVVLLSSIVMLAGLGQGVCGPPANNASLDLVPGQIAAAVGLRGMFRATGGVFGMAATILVVSQFGPQKAEGMQTVFLALGLIGLVAVPAVFAIPDTARQRFVATRERRRGATPVVH